MGENAKHSFLNKRLKMSKNGLDYIDELVKDRKLEEILGDIGFVKHLIKEVLERALKPGPNY